VNYEEIPKFPHSGYEVAISYSFLPEWLDGQLEQGLDLNPDFQRGHVWTEEQQRRFVEYQLRGGEGGKVLHFNHPSWSGKIVTPDYEDYVILDGLQRLTAITRFLRDELTVFGHRCSQISGPHLRNRVGIKWRIYELQTRADVLQYYLDMNAGGTQHAESEIERVRALLQKEVA
jgi:hypothetical protein